LTQHGYATEKPVRQQKQEGRSHRLLRKRWQADRRQRDLLEVA